MKNGLCATLIAAMLGAACAGWLAPAPAQTFPSKPVEFVVHTAPGGGSDLFTRTVADIITKQKLVAQPVVITNKGGGGGAVAFNYVAGRRGDPYTVLAVATTVLLTAPIRSGLDLGLDKFTPLGLFGFDLNCLAVREGSPYGTLKEFVDAAKREPNSIVIAVGSFGGTGHYLAYQLEKRTGARFKIVSMKSGGEAVLQVLGGHVQATTENLSEMMAQVEAKKMRVLGVPAAQRLAEAPGVPTMREQGLDIRAGVGRGFAMPADVPKDAAAALEATLQKAHQSAAWREYAAKNMFDNVYMNGAEFARYLAERRPDMVQFMSDVGLAKKK